MNQLNVLNFIRMHINKTCDPIVHSYHDLRSFYIGQILCQTFLNCLQNYDPQLILPSNEHRKPHDIQNSVPNISMPNFDPLVTGAITVVRLSSFQVSAF